MTNREAYLDDLDELLKEIDQLLSAVDDSMADMGKKTQFGTEQTGGWRDAYRALGFQDGRRFDPASRLSDGVPGQLMIGG